MRLARESESLLGGVRAGPKMAEMRTAKQALNTTLIPTIRETSLRETITPSRPSNNSVHNLDIKSDTMHQPGLVSS